MMEWVPIHADGLVGADVIRWKKGIYKPQRSHNAKPLRVGDRLLTAEVIKEPDAKGWVRLRVWKSGALVMEL